MDFLAMEFLDRNGRTAAILTAFERFADACTACDHHAILQDHMSDDSYLTSKVKVRFVDQRKFQVNHVKVVTENNVVYLLGMVTRKEAENAVEIARTTGGVQKVVKLFEYLD